jgi:hypothetical protein
LVYGDAFTVAYTNLQQTLFKPLTRQQDFGCTNVANNVAASIPVFTSAVIQNTTPTKLEMTYSLTCRHYSFPYCIHRESKYVTRTVSLVAVSGTKVTLTLASPVVYGDAVPWLIPNLQQTLFKPLTADSRDFGCT